MIRIDTLLPNTNNPRIVRNKDFQKLVESLKGFPQMMEKRPLVIRSWDDPVLLGGNQRLAALVELGYQELPDNWVMTAEGWSDDQMKEFMIKDNEHAGMWDWGKLEDWNMDQLTSWGLGVPSVKTVKDGVKNYNNNNCSYPIVPKWGESNHAIVIVCDNEKDLKHLQSILELGIETAFKKGSIGQTFVTTAKKIIAKWKTETQEK